MTEYDIQLLYQGDGLFNVNICWENLNAISLSVTKLQLKRLRSEIDDTLKEREGKQ